MSNQINIVRSTVLPQQPSPSPASNQQSWLSSPYYIANCLPGRTATVTTIPGTISTVTPIKTPNTPSVYELSRKIDSLLEVIKDVTNRTNSVLNLDGSINNTGKVLRVSEDGLTQVWDDIIVYADTIPGPKSQSFPYDPKSKNLYLYVRDGQNTIVYKYDPITQEYINIGALIKYDSITEAISIGTNALFFNTSGQNNVAFGRSALQDNTIGNDNISIGEGTLKSNISGSDNIGLGNSALTQNVSGDQNIAIGVNTLTSMQNNSNNVAIGSNVLEVSTANNNTSVGAYSMQNNLSGVNNSAYGFSALNKNISGNNNTAIGNSSLMANLASENTAIGNNAMFTNTSGSSNTCLGCESLFLNNQGSQNVAIGRHALYNNDGNQNTAVGTEALNSNTTGSLNSGFGIFSLMSNTSGDRNTAFGCVSMIENTIGERNTAIGSFSNAFCVSGNLNCAVGNDSLMNNLNGNSNTSIGALSLLSLSSGSNNIGLGQNSGNNLETGDANIYIGSDNTFAIATSVSESNTTKIGNAGTTHTFVSGIRGTTTDIPDAVPVLIDSSGQLGTLSSSIKYKENIEDMNDHSKFIYDLRPVVFNYKTHKKMQYGLIAEEVDKVNPELVVYKDKEPETVHYDKLITVLLNEVQRLNKEVKEIKELLHK